MGLMVHLAQLALITSRARALLMLLLTPLLLLTTSPANFFHRSDHIFYR